MFSDPQFWVLVAFIIFVIAIFNPVRKILLPNLDKKIDEIKNSINQAEKLKNESQITLSEIKKRQNQVKLEIDEINNRAKEKILSIEKNAQIKLNEQIEKRHSMATAKIDKMLRDANDDIKNYIANKAILAASNILEKKLTDEEKQNLIDKSIKELNSAINN